MTSPIRQSIRDITNCDLAIGDLIAPLMGLSSPGCKPSMTLAALSGVEGLRFGLGIITHIEML